MRSLSLLVLVIAATSVRADSLGDKEQAAIQHAVDHAATSVVQIQTVGGLEKVGRVLGNVGATSGVVVGADGYIISSAFNFITQPASIIVTTPDGAKHAARVVARDRARMLVLLQIEAEQPLIEPNVVPRNALRVGQWAIAVGKTYDPAIPNVSVGIVSATDRIWGRAIQTDAKVSPVNYGGALVDIRGNVMGVLVPLSNQSSSEVAGSELYDSGIGFAVPMEDILARLDQLQAGDDLRPGLMGITLTAKSLYDGPVVLATCPVRSPAAKAGLRPGDQLVSINDQNLRHQADLKQVLGPLQAGDVVEVVALRDGKSIAVELELTDAVDPYEQPYLGVLADRDFDQPGLRIRHVFADSPAAIAGLQPGQVLTALNNKPLADIAQWRDALFVAEPGDAVTLSGKSEGGPFSLELTLGPVSGRELLPERLSATPAENNAKVELVNVKLPEEKMKCQALVPEGTDDRPHGMLVWLPSQPHQSEEQIRNSWESLARQHGLVILVPEPAEDDRWEPAELLVIRKLMDEAIRRFNIDPERIVLAGTQTGGAVAYRLGSMNHELIKGVCVAGAPIPRRTAMRGNDPIERTSYLLLQDPNTEEGVVMAANAEALQALKLPVTILEQSLVDDQLTAEGRATVARWCDALDRL